MDLVQVFGRNVQDRRKELGLTQEGLESLTGLRRSYISDLERGRRNPTIRALQRLADALQTEPAALVRLPNRA